MAYRRRGIASNRANFLNRLEHATAAPVAGPSRTPDATPAVSRTHAVPTAGPLRTFNATPSVPRTYDVSTAGPSRTQAIRPPQVVPQPHQARPANYECVACTDSFPPPPAATIQELTICQECFDESVRPLFQQHLTDETAPVVWSGNEVKIDAVQHQFQADFVQRYRERMREYAVLPNQRLYCAGPGCEKFLGPKSTQGLTRKTCPNCKQVTCSKCSMLAPRAGHNCSQSAVAGPSTATPPSDPLLGLQRGRDYQICPKCGVVVYLSDACNHMTCLYKSCGMEFCYICGQEARDPSHWVWPDEGPLVRTSVRCRMWGLPPATAQPGNPDAKDLPAALPSPAPTDQGRNRRGGRARAPGRIQQVVGGWPLRQLVNANDRNVLQQLYANQYQAPGIAQAGALMQAHAAANGRAVHVPPPPRLSEAHVQAIRDGTELTPEQEREGEEWNAQFIRDLNPQPRQNRNQANARARNLRNLMYGNANGQQPGGWNQYPGYGRGYGAGYGRGFGI